MADISVEQKGGDSTVTGGQHTWIWALVALAAVAGLMFWLYTQSQAVEESIAMAEQAAAAEAEAEAAAEEADQNAVELSAVAATPDAYVGQPVAVRNVTVAASLGERAFWADIPGQNPFLVILGPEVANAEAAAPGEAVNLQGVVEPVTDELVAEWVEQAVLREGAQAEASFATHYLIANQMAAGQAGAAAAPSDTAPAGAAQQ